MDLFFSSYLFITNNITIFFCGGFSKSCCSLSLLAYSFPEATIVSPSRALTANTKDFAEVPRVAPYTAGVAW